MLDAAGADLAAGLVCAANTEPTANAIINTAEKKVAFTLVLVIFDFSFPMSRIRPAVYLIAKRDDLQ